MKKILFVAAFTFVFGLALPTSSFAQGIMGNIAGTNNMALQNDDGHTAREEAEGKAVWEKLQAKQISCADLSDENFGTLGEYFMGQMMGTSHEAMNNMMIQMHGEEWEEQIHIVMGKRLSGCDTSVAFPGDSGSWMPMNMMWGGWSSPLGTNQSNNSMMNFGFTPFGGFGWIFMFAFWGIIIWAIIALIKGGFGRSHMCRHDHGYDAHEKEKSPLEILKERYAKSEIDKKEFEERKKDLS
ncbi:MAG: SHOCT domain-containing protein [bacterium]|nr:SHOCT domain-containing protein [bacterium]